METKRAVSKWHALSNQGGEAAKYSKEVQRLHLHESLGLCFDGTVALTQQKFTHSVAAAEKVLTEPPSRSVLDPECPQSERRGGDDSIVSSVLGGRSTAQSLALS